MADTVAAAVVESCNHHLQYRRPSVRPLRPADRTNAVGEAWRPPERLEQQHFGLLGRSELPGLCQRLWRPEQPERLERHRLPIGTSNIVN